MQGRTQHILKGGGSKKTQFRTHEQIQKILLGDEILN